MTGALLVIALAAAPAVEPRYREAVERYARGERTEALTILSAFSDEEAGGFVQSVQRATARGVPPVNLKAAAMLHVDRDESLRSIWMGSEREIARRCPGVHARFAERYAVLLALRPEPQRDFTQRFYVAMALRSQWDGCQQEAQAWAGRGLQLFPRDPALLTAMGASLEESATLYLGPSGAAATAGRINALKDAQRFFEQAVAADTGNVAARVHLGRVLWRLGKEDAAREALETAIGQTQGSESLYLAHLFLGRVEEDAGRLEPAAMQYREALVLDPKAQAAAIALAHALRLAGEAAEASDVAARALAYSKTRGGHDGYWQYLLENAAHVQEMFAALRDEAGR